MRKRWAVTTILCLALWGVILGAAPASAHNQPYAWGTAFQWVGNCGNPNHVNQIKAAQANLWAENRYAGQPGGNTLAQVDGIWGPASNGAARAYQRAHGLTVDGCIGPNTWNNMHNQTVLKRSGSGWKEYGYRSKITYTKYTSSTNGHWFFKVNSWSGCMLELVEYADYC